MTVLLSSKVLTDTEINILEKGLDFELQSQIPVTIEGFESLAY